MGLHFHFVSYQWYHEDILGPRNQPLNVNIPPRTIILSNMKKKLYKLSQDEGTIVAVQVSILTTLLLHKCLSNVLNQRWYYIRY